MRSLYLLIFLDFSKKCAQGFFLLAGIFFFFYKEKKIKKVPCLPKSAAVSLSDQSLKKQAEETTKKNEFLPNSIENSVIYFPKRS